MAGIAIPRPPAVGFHHPTGPARALVVDADPGHRGQLCALLELADVEVVAQAGDGAEAIALTASYRPSVVLLADDLPVRRGIQALPRIRRLVPNACICLVGADLGAADDPRLLAADAVVQRGDPAEVVARVRDLRTIVI